MFRRPGLSPAPPEGPLPPARIGERTYLLNTPASEVVLNGRPGTDLHRFDPSRDESAEAAIVRVGAMESALVLAPGTEVYFEPAIPQGARLRFGVWRGKRSDGFTGSRLSVRVRSADGAEKTLWAETIKKPGPRGARMILEFDLDKHAGDSLVFGSALLPGDEPAEDSPVLGPHLTGFVSPVIESPGRLVQPAGDSKRNVVVFLIDTLRADRLGLYGHSKDTSPNVDRLGDESLVFLQAQSVASWTKPSVASLLTSRYPSQHGASNYASRINDSEVSLAHVFGKAGYRTAAIGVNGFVFNPSFNFHPGFDDFFQVIARDGDHGDTSRLVVDRVIGWLDRHYEEPFFLYVQVIDPHTPYHPPHDYGDEFVSAEQARLLETQTELLDEFESRTPEETSQDQLDSLLALYDAEIAFTDAELGRLVEHMRRLGVWEETTFVVCSDHGEEFLDHGDWGHGQTLYQEQLHVPLIVKPPASSRIQPARIERAVSLLDVAPTLCELAGVEDVPDTFRGSSLVRPEGTGAEPALLHELERFKPTYAVRRGDLKYIRRILGSQVEEELYRLDEDPGERENLIDSVDPETLAELRATLDAHLSEATPEGIVLEVASDGTEGVLEGRIRSAGELWDANLLGVESHGDVISPLLHGGEETSFSFELELGGGDKLDSVVFSAGDADRITLEILVDGSPLPELSLGAASMPLPGPSPFAVDTGSTDLRVPSRPAPFASSSGIQCRVWRYQKEAVTLPTDDVAALQALGYLGGE